MINGENGIIKELFPITKHSSPQSWEAHVVLMIDIRHVYFHVGAVTDAKMNAVLHSKNFYKKKRTLIAKNAPTIGI